MAHSTPIFGSLEHHSPEIISVHDGSAPDAAATAAQLPLPSPAAPVDEVAKKEAEAAKAQKIAKEAKKLEKTHASNEAFGYVVLGGSYVIERIMPNPHLKDTPDIHEDKRAWNACFGLSTAMFLLALSIQGITWSRKLLKYFEVNLHPNYALGLLRITLLGIGINYMIRSQLTHLNSITWVYIISIFVCIHGIYFIVWKSAVIPIREINRTTSTTTVGAVAAPAAGPAVAPSAPATGSNKWTVNADGSLVPPSSGCVVVLANKWRVDENGQLVLGFEN